MAKLNTYSTWIQDTRVYWESEIDAEVEAQQATLGYSDTEKEQMRTDLKATMNGHMDAVQSEAVAYENDSSKEDKFTGILLSVATYVMGKDIAATPEAPVKQIASLPSDDLRDLFAWWLVDLPSNIDLFTINISMVSDPDAPAAPAELTYSITTNPSYDTLLGDMSNHSADDIARFNTFVEQSGSAQLARAAYLLFSGSDAIIVRATNPDLNNKILVDYHAQEILDTFGWVIKGLNG